MIIKNKKKIHSIVYFFKKTKEQVFNFLKICNLAFPAINQKIQLTILYFFALVDLVYSVFNPIFSVGYIPEILQPMYPIIKKILELPLIKIWSSPEKVFFLSYIVVEIFIVRSVFKLSKLRDIIYNISWKNTF